MKRSPMKRGGPLKRSPIRRRLGSTKYSRRDRDLERMGWIKTLPCAVGGGPVVSELWMGPPPDHCQRATEAHHAGEHGLGAKAADDTCIPMCDHHHDALTDRRGVFAGWPRRAVKEWELAAIRHYQRAYSERDADVGSLF